VLAGGADLGRADLDLLGPGVVDDGVLDDPARRLESVAGVASCERGVERRQGREGLHGRTSATVRAMNFWEVSLDGWLGAVLGSLASIATAVFVLRRTLKHEREQFLSQLEAERELAVWQRQLEAFGDLSAKATQLGFAPTKGAELLSATNALTASVRLWRMYANEGEFPHAVEIIALHFERATWRARDEEYRSASAENRRPKERVSVEGVFEMSMDLMLFGRLWHQEPARRAEAEAWSVTARARAAELWPKRF
jgi:hypothetical protein